jgi:uncharacterized alpha-E superfamily protein
LDLHGVLAGPHELNWTSLAAILQQQVTTSCNNNFKPQALVSQSFTFDLGNPTSIMSCISRARYNARSIRGTINSAMWKELNKLYWQLADPEFSSRVRESPHEFYEAVECGSDLFQGVCDATLNHDEGWQFIQLGKFLERADKTLRIIDIQYHLLYELTDPADISLSNLQWAGVLRSCRAYEAYQRLYVGRVEREHVVEFLLLHPSFPRSARFCLEAAARALAAIEGPIPGRGLSKVDRILGQVLSDLKFAEIDQILQNDLHTFLANVLERCAQVTRGVQEQYSLH